MAGHVAVAQTEIDAPPAEVWRALTDEDTIERYMFGSKVMTDWKEGSSIVWRGEYEGQAYEDHGKILEVEPERRLRLTHFSAMSGRQDVPENYHTLVYELEQVGEKTRLVLKQDNNTSEEAAQHSQANWETMLAALKRVVEEE